jgi:hypothetical protein
MLFCKNLINLAGHAMGVADQKIRSGVHQGLATLPIEEATPPPSKLKGESLSKFETLGNA